MKNTLLVSILVFLFGVLIVSTVLRFTSVGDYTEDSLATVHREMILVEQRISEVKPICTELDQLRLHREELVNEINEIINSPNVSLSNVKEPPKAAPYESNLESYDVKIATSITNNVDLDKLSRAVGWAETHDCQLGYGKMFNNCVGLKNGSIAPCSKIGQNNMCIYDTPEDSYKAFRKVWSLGYGSRFPTYKDAQIYTGNDRPESWLSNVSVKYYE